MNKQILKSLQDRAQLLLEISSQDQQVADIYSERQYYGSKSRRVDLKEVLGRNNNQNQHLTDHNKDEEQFQQMRKTDIQLLKRCISLTSENSALKKQLSFIQNQATRLVNENRLLQAELKQSRQQHVSFNRTQKPLNRSARQKSQLNEKSDKRKAHFSNNKHQISNRLSQQQQSIRQSEYLSQYRQLANDFQSKQQRQRTKYQRQIDNLRESYQRKIGQLQQRLKTCTSRTHQIQKKLAKQKGKSHKLSELVTRQVPRLQQIITVLTAKVDYKVQNMLMKDTHAY